MTTSRVERAAPFRFAAETLRPGTRRRVEIPIARIPSTQTYVSIPVEILHGPRRGPCLWLSGAVHGDELNGIEIIRQVLERVPLARLRGTLLAVPVVNVFGVMTQSRYLPDRRDLNRSFPGSRRGSLAARIADTFMKEVVSRSTHGIDFHTGSNGRSNLPQIRCDLEDPETRRCARAFAAPVMVHARTRHGTLREAAARRGVKTLVYEAGEPLRFGRRAVSVGVEGTLRVLGHLDMLRRGFRKAREASLAVTETRWIRSRTSGLCRLLVREGDRVTLGQRLGVVSDSFGEANVPLKAPTEGLVIGMTRDAIVHRGDAVIHLATGFEPRRPASS